jgi:List-Bact-rpt repeat protein
VFCSPIFSVLASAPLRQMSKISIAIGIVGLGLMLGLPAAASAGTPSAITFDTYSTGATTATVEGVVHPNGESTTYAAQYDAATSLWCTSGGTSGSPANTTAGVDPIPDGDFVSVALSGLTENTSYCAQLVATNGSGDADGGQVAWTQGTPFAHTYEVDPSGVSTAMVMGDINAAGKTTSFWVEYDVSSSQWCESGGFSGSPANVSASIPWDFTDGIFRGVLLYLSGLSEGTTYCAAIVATNADGPSELFQAFWTQPTPPITLTVHVTGSGTVVSTPAGIDCSTTCSATFDPGTHVTLTASGGTFLSWGGASDCLAPPGSTPTPTCTITLDSDMVVGGFFATVRPTTRALTVQPVGDGSGTVTSTPAGIICGPTCSSSFVAGSQVTLTATPAPGSTFDSWGGECSGIGTCVTTIDADKSRLSMRIRRCSRFSARSRHRGRVAASRRPALRSSSPARKRGR